MTLGGSVLKNRVVLPAHSYNFPADKLGFQRLAAYVERRLSANVAMAIVGEADVSGVEALIGTQTSHRRAGEPSRVLYDLLSSMRERTGALVIEQLYHPGGQVWFEESRLALAPSAVPHARSYTVPRPLSRDEIIQIERNFVACAIVAFQAGMDGVEFKADQGKLLHQFLSPYYNRRTDEYGLDLDGRIRILKNVVTQVRNSTGSDFILGIRLPGNVSSGPQGIVEAVPPDLTFELNQQIISIISSWGIIDYISISGDTNSTVWGYRQGHGDSETARKAFWEVSAKLKKSCNIPLMLSGMFTSMDQVEEALSENVCDIVGVARALISDPDFVEKSEFGTKRDQPLLSCTSCNISCVGSTWYGDHIRCIYNPSSGYEVFAPKVVSRKLKRVAIGGAGPSGATLAIELARSGHEAVVIERSNDIGGRALDWAKLPGRSGFRRAVDYWKLELDRLKVDVQFRADFSDIDHSEFDRSVWAGGASYSLPDTVGLNNSVNLTYKDVLILEECEGKSFLLIEGDRFQDPLAFAVLLKRLGAHVSIATPFDTIGVGYDPVSRARYLAELAVAKVPTYTWTEVIWSSSEQKAILFDHCSNSIVDASFDASVWCVNPLPISPTARRNIGGLVSSEAVGDAIWPKGMETAVRSAYLKAIELIEKA